MKINIIKSKISMKLYVRDSILSGLLGTLVLAIVFIGLEPSLILAIEDQLTITQVVTAEISFATASGDVVMTPQLPGVTGGTSFGTSTVVVYTNDSLGYTMTIVASTSPAMKGYLGTDSIPDYTPTSSSIPDFTYGNPAANTAEFAYTVSASTTADLAQKFKDDGATCNTGSSDTSGSASCWYNLSTVATSTILRTTATAGSGSTSSLVFKLKIMPSSSVTQDTYQATTTLTATAN